MAKELDRIPADIACVPTPDMPFTLVSTLGFHCEVWQGAGTILRSGRRSRLDLVLKLYKWPCTFPEIRVLRRENAELRSGLGDMVPASRFVATRVDGVPGVIVLAQTCTPWFDLANPGNESEAVPLLQRLTKACSQLARFVRAARGWVDAEDRVVDLSGAENLVLDKRYRVRYLDSFHVFLHRDMLHDMQSADDELRYRIERSMQRLDYLERIVERTAMR